jgi:hypothetical protein
MIVAAVQQIGSQGSRFIFSFKVLKAGGLTKHLSQARLNGPCIYFR